MSDEWEVPPEYFLGHSPYARHAAIRAFPRDPPFLPIPEHGWSFPERVPSSWPLGFSRLPAPALATPFMMFDPAVTRQRQHSSGLTADEQATVLRKLRKDIYNSSPRRFSRMISTYYRDQNSSRASLDARDYDEDSKRCSVCLEDFESGEEVTITPCDHMFHENCIVPWVKDHGQCPVCRFSLYERETPQNQASREPNTAYQHWEAMLFVPRGL